MNLKQKISFRISLLFTVIFAIAATVIYVLFSGFRKEEFEKRLNEKALSTIILLVDVEQVDRKLLQIIDQNTINKLYQEKTLIFDANYKLIYSSLDDTKIQWNTSDLDYLKSNKTFFKKANEQEVYGFYYKDKNKDYYALISATDQYGKRKLEYLLFILVGTYLFFTVLTWIITYKFVERMLSPLDFFLSEIKKIKANHFETAINIKRKDEIGLLAVEFNLMLQRLNIAYLKQQEFTANASHELRTPLARLMLQLENKIQQNEHISTDFLTKILTDVVQLNQLTDSLLLLSKLEKNVHIYNDICRIDEIIELESNKINKLYTDFSIDLKFDSLNGLEVKGNIALLSIAFYNLFKNAYLYASNKKATVVIASNASTLKVEISNDGSVLSSENRDSLFQPFSRGDNARNTNGLGLGLRITERILNYHNAKITYYIADNGYNVFSIVFDLG